MNQKTYKNLCFFANIKSDALWTQSFSYLANSRKDVKPNNGMNYSKHIDRTFFRLLLIFHWLERSFPSRSPTSRPKQIPAKQGLELNLIPPHWVFRGNGKVSKIREEKLGTFHFPTCRHLEHPKRLWAKERDRRRTSPVASHRLQGRPFARLLNSRTSGSGSLSHVKCLTSVKSSEFETKKILQQILNIREVWICDLISVRRWVL